MKTLVIGRSQFADIVVPETSVAARHAELVVTVGGRLHLTDCASGQGTWRRIADGENAWEPVRQAFVDAEQEIRFGDFRCTLGTLLREAAGTGETDAAGGRNAADRERPRGRVERDPRTGEIVRRRL